MAATKGQAKTNNIVVENMPRGFVYSLVGPLAGLALWVVLWQVGFIASLSAWLIAAWAVKYYEKGAGALSRQSLKVILPVIVAGVFVAFLSGMVSDAYDSYVVFMQEDKITDYSFFSADFADFVVANLTHADIWLAYKWDILIALAFAGLGSWGTISALFAQTAALKPSKN